MKANTLFSFLLLSFFCLISTNIQAQTEVDLPNWAPKYIPETRYYYLPEIEIYYDIPSKMYIYYHENGWIRSENLPKKYRRYNLVEATKVSLFDIGPNPYVYNENHRTQYSREHNREVKRSSNITPTQLKQKNNSTSRSQTEVENNNNRVNRNFERREAKRPENRRNEIGRPRAANNFSR